MIDVTDDALAYIKKVHDFCATSKKRNDLTPIIVESNDYPKKEVGKTISLAFHATSEIDEKFLFELDGFKIASYLKGVDGKLIDLESGELILRDEIKSK